MAKTTEPVKNAAAKITQAKTSKTVAQAKSAPKTTTRPAAAPKTAVKKAASTGTAKRTTVTKKAAAVARAEPKRAVVIKKTVVVPKKPARAAKKVPEKEPKRSFKAIYTSLKPDEEGRVVIEGRFCGTKPKQAASKALTLLYHLSHEYNNEIEGPIVFGIKECTRGCKGKYYWYTGTRYEIAKGPAKVPVRRRNPDVADDDKENPLYKIPIYHTRKVRDENGVIVKDENNKAIEEEILYAVNPDYVDGEINTVEEFLRNDDGTYIEDPVDGRPRPKVIPHKYYNDVKRADTSDEEIVRQINVLEVGVEEIVNAALAARAKAREEARARGEVVNEDDDADNIENEAETKVPRSRGASKRTPTRVQLVDASEVK